MEIGSREHELAVELLFRHFMGEKFFDEEFLEPHDIIDELLSFARGGWQQVVVTTVQNLDFKLSLHLHEDQSLLGACEAAFGANEPLVSAAVAIAMAHRLHLTLEEFL